MNRFDLKRHRLIRRKKRVRKKVSGTADKPRLSVFRSSKNIYCQLVDDVSGKTILGVSSLAKEVKSIVANGSKGKIDIAKNVGFVIGKKALQLGVIKVVFDRHGHMYHGRIMAVADGARASGLKL